MLSCDKGAEHMSNAKAFWVSFFFQMKRSSEAAAEAECVSRSHGTEVTICFEAFSFYLG